MATKRTTTRRSTTTRSSTSRTPAVPRHRTRHFWLGTGAIVLGVIGLLYLAVGLYLYLTPTTGKFFTAFTGPFNYIAAITTVPGYTWWGLASLLATIAAAISVLYLAFHLIFRGTAFTKLMKIATGLFVVGFAASFFLPAPTHSLIGYHGYLQRFDALQKFSGKQQELAKQQGSTQPAQTKDEMRAQALQQLMLGDVIRQEAWKYDVKVSDKEINDAYKQYADRNQGEDNLKKQIKDFLGWSPATFKNEIRVKLLEEKINQKLTNDDKLNKDRREKIDSLLKQVKDEKKDFATVAKDSDDPAAQSGTEPAFSKKGENDPAIEDVAFKMNVGDISDVIKTQQGYAVIKLEDKKDDTVKIRQIVIRTKSLQDVIPSDLRGLHVSLFVHDIVWNSGLTSIEPKNQQSQQPNSPAEASGSPGTTTTTSAPVPTPAQ